MSPPGVQFADSMRQFKFRPFREVQEIRVRFRRLLSAAVAVAALSLFLPQLHAQITATAPVAVNPVYAHHMDIFGGAQYAHFNPARGTGVHAINMEGWNATFTDWVKPSFGLEASTRNVYGTIIPPVNGYGIKNYSASQNLFLFGVAARFLRTPRYDFGMHFDIGGTYGNFDKGYPSNVQPIDVGIFNSQLAFATAIGAFSDYNVNPHWAVRLYTDWQPTFYGKTYQDEFAGALGLVYKFGK